MTNELDEYKEIQKFRRQWSKDNIRLGHILLPLSFVVISLFFTQFQNNNVDVNKQHLLIFGGFFLFSFLIFWRIVSYALDKQIVELYPGLLELEKKLQFEFHSSYYFRNLNKKGKTCLANLIGIIDQGLTNTKYPEFKELITKVNNNQYDVLLGVWEEHGRKSVTSRGHRYYTSIVAIILLIYLAFSLQFFI